MIPVVDVDLEESGAWAAAFAPHKRSLVSLLRAVDGVVESEVGPTAWWGIKKLIGVGGRVYGGFYARESAELAELAGVYESDIRAANLVYDLAQTSHVGCSTLAVRREGRGAVLARNLDWSLGGPSLLQRTLVVGRFTGAPAGDYVSVTWPGLFGCLTAMAPGRFSLAINYVVHATDSGPVPVAGALMAGAMPVTWATRYVLDTCGTFAEAVAYLRDVPLAAPVLFTVTGMSPDERVVIERSAGGASLRKPARGGGPVVVTNHYVGSRYRDCNGVDEALGEDSGERYAGVEDGVSLGANAPGELFKVLSRHDVVRADTQYQVVMSAAEGVLHCRVPGGRAQLVTM